MLTAVKGTYTNGQIILQELPIVQNGTEVVVTFLTKDEEKRIRRSGSMRGEVWMSDDFNSPLDDLSEYV